MSPSWIGSWESSVTYHFPIAFPFIKSSRSLHNQRCPMTLKQSIGFEEPPVKKSPCSTHANATSSIMNWP